MPPISIRWPLAGLALLALAGCGDNGAAPANTAQAAVAPAPVERPRDFALETHGARLYQEHCAQCHGKTAEGAPDWRKRLPDGSFPPPPLNGTGHAWHHPERELLGVIAYGRNRMPAWREKLTIEEMRAIVAWFQSRWPNEIYDVWYQGNQRALARSR